MSEKKLLMPHDRSQELPLSVCPTFDLSERSLLPSEELSFAQEVTATSILRVWKQNDLCFKPIKFHVLPIENTDTYLKFPFCPSNCVLEHEKFPRISRETVNQNIAWDPPAQQKGMMVAPRSTLITLHPKVAKIARVIIPVETVLHCSTSL